jgi:hypothetical protein
VFAAARRGANEVFWGWGRVAASQCVGLAKGRAPKKRSTKGASRAAYGYRSLILLRGCTRVGARAAFGDVSRRVDGCRGVQRLWEVDAVARCDRRPCRVSRQRVTATAATAASTTDEGLGAGVANAANGGLGADVATAASTTAAATTAPAAAPRTPRTPSALHASFAPRTPSAAPASCALLLCAGDRAATGLGRRVRARLWRRGDAYPSGAGD